MSINVAIGVTQRFECLNVYLDILKNNFKREYTTHVFCNLDKSNFDQYSGYIDFSLIDHFHHFPDDCKMKQVLNHRISHKYKREQPFRLFSNMLGLMIEKPQVEKFIYTECDVFPLNENLYTRYYDHTTSQNTYAYYNTDCDTKSTFGFIVPAPIYISKNQARILFKTIKSEVEDPVIQHDLTNSFEGRLMMCFLKSNLKLFNIQKYHACNSHFSKNLMKETETTHQHNILNLSDTLKQRQITNGKWVKSVLDNDEFYELYSDKIIKKDPNFRLEYWK